MKVSIITVCYNSAQTIEDTLHSVDGLLKLLNDEALRSELSRLGMEWAASFSWERTATETLAVIEKAAMV